MADFNKRTVRVEPALDSSGNGENQTALEVPKKTDPTHRLPPYDLSYDKLVIAVGCYSQSFGIKGVSEDKRCFNAGDILTLEFRYGSTPTS